MTDAKPPPDPPPADPARTTRIGALALVGLIVLLLILHLVGDRFTPYSDQGRVDAYVVAIAPEVGGQIDRVAVRDNQRVHRGDLLFSIDRLQYEIAAQKARADIISVRRDLAASDANIEGANANLAAARAGLIRAQQDASRTERIYQQDSGAISVRRVETTRATLSENKARAAAAVAQLEQARQGRGATGEENDRLIAARSALEKAELDLRRTQVVAPADGLITDLTADIGAYAGPGTPVMTFIAVHDGWVSVDMTENNLGHMKPGDRAEIVFDIAPGDIVKGRVRSIGYGVSSGQNENHAPGKLPTIENDRDWLRQAQRFPVIIEFDPAQLKGVNGPRPGGQIDAIVYTGHHPILNALGWLYVRLIGLLSYAY
jgi:multidrug resistance efflux pump